MMKKNNQKIIILITIILVIVILLYFIFNINLNNKVKEDVSIIKIGVIAPMTGPLAEFGIALKNGLILASEESNNVNYIKFYFEDSQYDGTKAISGYQKLVTINDVDLVLSWGNPPASAISAQMTNESVPLLSISTNKDIITNSKVIRLYNKPEEQAESMLKYLRDKNISKIGVIKLEDDYHISIYNGLLNKKLDFEEITLIDTVLWNTMDFRSIITKIKTKDFDVLAPILCGSQISEFYTQLKEFGIDTISFGEDCFEDLSVIENSNGSMEDVLFMSIGTTKNFEDKYIERFKSKSSIFVAGSSYDIYKIIESNLDKNIPIMTILSNVNNYNGAMGEYSYIETNDDRYFNYSTKIRKIKNEQITTIAEYKN